MENNETYLEAISEGTRQMLTAQTKAAIAVIDAITKPKTVVGNLSVAKLCGVTETDGELITELRNWRTDLCLSGDDCRATLLALAIQQLGGDV